MLSQFCNGIRGAIKPIVFLLFTLGSLTSCESTSLTSDNGVDRSFGAVNKAAFCETVAGLTKDAQSTAALPGLSVAVILQDRSSCLAANGYADVEQTKLMAPKHRFLTGSTGKTFVAATLMSLHMQGVLNFDDPISKYLGHEGFFDRLPHGQDISIRQLTNHTSGLNNHVFTKEFANLVIQTVQKGAEVVISPQELVEFGLTQEPIGKPGEKYFYSDTGYILLGMIIEQATGRDYYDVLQDAVLSPLSLSGISRSDRMYHDNIVVGYDEKKTFGDSFPARSVNYKGEMNWNPGSEWTGGGLVTTPESLAKFTWYLYRGEAFEGEYVKEMTTLGKVYGAKHSRNYGLGTIIKETDYGMSYGHGGWVPGYVTRMVYFPKLELSIAMQTNGDNSERYKVLEGLIMSIATEYSDNGKAR